MAAGLVLFALAWTGHAAFGQGLHPKIDALHRLSLPFALGVLIFALRHRLPMTLRGVAALWALALAAAGTPLQHPAQVAALGYSLFWLAYVPRGPLRTYNRIGDYSYGVYIYAFPLQGLMVWLFGPMTPWLNIASALPATLFCAVLSWHLVEAPALALLQRRPNPSAA